MDTHPLVMMGGRRVKVVLIDQPGTVWTGKLVEVTVAEAPCIVLHVVERGEETGRDVVMPLSSVVRLWAA